LAGAGEFFTGQQVFQHDAELAGLTFLGEFDHFLGRGDGLVIDGDLVVSALGFRGGFDDLAADGGLDLAGLELGGFFAGVGDDLRCLSKRPPGPIFQPRPMYMSCVSSKLPKWPLKPPPRPPKL
jgi:hypothetical protein